MLINAQHIFKEYGIQTVLDIEKLEIHDGDRIGLVGPNGAGKSTLLGILKGDVVPDRGMVERFCDIAMIRQSGEAEGLADQANLSRMLLKHSAIISGGERTRLAIAAAFSQHAPLLFADEPTTNLDLNGIEMLEKMLAGYRGGLVLISHDRQLLDRVCTHIWELDGGCLRLFPGNYSDWLAQRQREHDFAAFEYEQYRSEKRRLEQRIAVVKSAAKDMRKPPKQMGSSEWMLYKGTAAIRQGHVQKRGRALESRLAHLEIKSRPNDLPAVSMKLGAFSPIRAKIAARVEGLTVQYNDKTVLRDVDFQVQSGKRTFLVGPNGAGKTTLIRQILQRGTGVFINSEAEIGYFAQDCDILDPEKSVIDNVKSTACVPEHVCRAVLANLCIRETDIQKRIAVLSGGERVKTALAKILVSRCNLIILDEPTNHMDLYTMEGLQQLLQAYEGTLLVISHDRHLVEHTADIIYELEDGRVKEKSCR